jgi:hypothetical protein
MPCGSTEVPHEAIGFTCGATHPLRSSAARVKSKIRNRYAQALKAHQDSTLVPHGYSKLHGSQARKRFRSTVV